MTQTNTKPIQKARFILALPLLALFIAVFSCESSNGSGTNFPNKLDIPMASESSSDTTKVSSALGKDGKEVFDVVEIQPDPAGGMEGWMKYLGESLQYPAGARDKEIEGTVIIAFIINLDGTISDVEVIRGIGGGCDEEAMRVIENAPNWTPAQNDGKPVNCKMRLPIRFKLS